MLLGFFSFLLSPVFYIQSHSFKEKIATWISEDTGQTITLEENISLHLFPKIGLEFKKVQLRPRKDMNFFPLQADNVRIYPNISSLMSGPLSGTVEIEGMKVWNEEKNPQVNTFNKGTIKVNDFQIKNLETSFSSEQGLWEFWDSKIHVIKNNSIEKSEKTTGETTNQTTIEKIAGALEETVHIDYFKIDTQTNPNKPEYTLKHQADHFPLSRLSDMLGFDSTFSGESAIQIELIAQGKTIDHLKKSLQGQFEVRLRSGVIQGFDLLGSFKEAKSLAQSLSAKLLPGLINKERPRNKTHNIPEKRQEHTPYSSIKIIGNVSKGVIQKDFSMSHDYYHIRGHGILNFLKNSLDYHLEAQYAGQGGMNLSQSESGSSASNSSESGFSKLSPLKIHVTGDINKPNIKTEMNSYFKFIQQKTKKP